MELRVLLFGSFLLDHLLQLFMSEESQRVILVYLGFFDLKQQMSQFQKC